MCSTSIVAQQADDDCRTIDIVKWEHQTLACNSPLGTAKLFCADIQCVPPCGAGAPLFLPLSIYFLIFCPFYFPFLSLALPIFLFCPSLPFVSVLSHSVSRPEVVGSDRTWV